MDRQISLRSISNATDAGFTSRQRPAGSLATNGTARARDEFGKFNLTNMIKMCASSLQQAQLLQPLQLLQMILMIFSPPLRLTTMTMKQLAMALSMMTGENCWKRGTK